jgi:hypothetical protein
LYMDGIIVDVAALSMKAFWQGSTRDGISRCSVIAKIFGKIFVEAMNQIYLSKILGLISTTCFWV